MGPNVPLVSRPRARTPGDAASAEFLLFLIHLVPVSIENCSVLLGGKVESLVLVRHLPYLVVASRRLLEAHRVSQGIEVGQFGNGILQVVECALQNGALLLHRRWRAIQSFVGRGRE